MIRPVAVVAAALAVGALSPALAPDAHAQVTMPSAATATEQKEWYYAVGTATSGPHDLVEMQQFIQGTVIKPDTQVYVARNGWRMAKDQPELAGFFGATAAPGAPPPPPPPGPAPAPAPSTQELQKIHEAYIVGTWRSEFVTESMNVRYNVVADLSYMPDGMVRGLYTFNDQVNPMNTIVMSAAGTYSVQAIDAKTFMLTANIQWNGVGGSDRIVSSMEAVDQNTLRNTQTGNVSTRQR